MEVVEVSKQESTKKHKNPSNYAFNCECGKNFNHQKHFNAHRRKVHNEQKASQNNPQKKCPLCDCSAKFRDEMVKHYETVHNISFVEEKFTLENEAEFSLWKLKMESKTNSKFISNGTQTFADHKMTHFYCHRSGNFIPKGNGLRSLKTQGSVKMNSFCPSRITKKCLSSGTCVINYSGTHVGHENELKYLTLKSVEREELAKKIALEIPFDDVLDEIRDSIYDNNTLQRIHLLTRKDLHNIKAAYNLHSKAVRHKDDATSVDYWDIEMEKEEINTNCESAICELSKNKPDCEDIDKRKEKLQTAFQETLNSISNIEEIEFMERLHAQASPLLAGIREKSSFPKQQNDVANKSIVPQRHFSTKKKKSGKQLNKKKRITCPTSSEINQSAVRFIINKDE